METAHPVPSIIAVGLVVVRTLFPNLLALLLLGTLREHKGLARANPILWCVDLLRSGEDSKIGAHDRPTVLNIDMEALNSVSTSVAFFRDLGLLRTLFLLVSIIITCLGRHEAVILD
jgi:hypothetical protein